MIKQVTVFLPNEPGALARMGRLLGKYDIQIHGLSVSSMGEAGFVRMICADPDAAVKALEGEGYQPIVSRVLALEVDNIPGGLARALSSLESLDLNIDYVYTCPLGSRVVDIVAVSGEPVDVKLRGAGIVGLGQGAFETS